MSILIQNVFTRAGVTNLPSILQKLGLSLYNQVMHIEEGRWLGCVLATILCSHSLTEIGNQVIDLQRYSQNVGALTVKVRNSMKCLCRLACSVSIFV